MPELNRKSIFSNTKKTIEKVITEEWGGNGFVYVRVFSAMEIHRIMDLAKKIQTGKVADVDALAYWCILGVCDKNGKCLFQDGDKDKLLKGPYAPMQRCAMRAMQLNGFTDAGQKAIAKN